MRAKVLHSGLKFLLAYPFSTVALSYYSNQQTYCHKQTPLSETVWHTLPLEGYTEPFQYLLFHILLPYTVSSMFITTFVLTHFRNNYITEIGSRNKRKNVTGIKRLFTHCGAFHQINKVKEIRANSLNAKLAPRFYKAYAFMSKRHLIFYTYCTIILI